MFICLISLTLQGRTVFMSCRIDVIDMKYNSIPDGVMDVFNAIGYDVTSVNDSDTTLVSNLRYQLSTSKYRHRNSSNSTNQDTLEASAQQSGTDLESSISARNSDIILNLRQYIGENNLPSGKLGYDTNLALTNCKKYFAS